MHVEHRTGMIRATAAAAALLLSLAGGYGLAQASDPPAAGSEKKDAKGMMEKKAEAAGEKVTTSSGLQYEDLVVGTGPSPTPGQIAVVHYTGWLTDGKKFDSSHDRNQPFEFPLGRGRVIKGWDEGVATMKVGGKRKLYIPPDLGYGARGAGGVIPPNAKLIFEVDLLSLK